jgi:hypothetical protein
VGFETKDNQPRCEFSSAGKILKIFQKHFILVSITTGCERLDWQFSLVSSRDFREIDIRVRIERICVSG